MLYGSFCNESLGWQPQPRQGGLQWSRSISITQKWLLQVFLFLLHPVLSVKSYLLLWCFTVSPTRFWVWLIFHLHSSEHFMFYSVPFQILPTLVFMVSHPSLVLTISMTSIILLFILQYLCNHFIIGNHGILRPLYLCLMTYTHGFTFVFQNFGL